MIALLRRGVLGAADALGVNRGLARSKWRNQRLLILCYHGFALGDEHRWDPQLFISPQTFRRRLGWLRDHRFNVLPLGEALQRLRAGSLPQQAVSLTIDDGLYDFAAVGVPLLREFGFPATVYVSTYYVEHPWPVFSVMSSYLLWLAAARAVPSLRLALLGSEPLSIASPAARRLVWGRLTAAASRAGLDGAAKNRLLGELAATLGVDYARVLESRMLTLMRPDELRGLDAGLVDVQLHTHRHRVPEDRELFLREISDNRAALVRAGRPANGLVHFCYPSGVYRPELLPWLREAGIESATTCEPGLAAANSDPLLLPRFIDHDSTPESEFKAWTSGLRALLNRRTLGL